MEGSKNIAFNRNGRISNGHWVIAAIILFHLVGFIGLSIPYARPLFLKIVPFHLMLMFFLLVSNHREPDKGFFIFVLLLFVLGFSIEWIGVHTGVLFGHYRYGDTLGPKVLAIPLTIGMNWVLLIYCAGIFMQKLDIQKPLLSAVIGAITLVLLDYLIEPVAIRLDYWHWQNNVIPVENYLCWFLISAAMLYLFNRFNFKEQNWVAPALLLAQFVFFAALKTLT